LSWDAGLEEKECRSCDGRMENVRQRRGHFYLMMRFSDKRS
jgi:hypothetical protein